MAVERAPHRELVWPFVITPSPRERFCVIPFNFSLSANAFAKQIYTLSAGWDFIVTIINSFSTGAYVLNITDTYTAEDLFLGPVRNVLVTGDGKDSFVLPKFHKFFHGRSIEVSVTDISGASNTIQIVLIGHKEIAGEVTGYPATKLWGELGEAKQKAPVVGDRFRVERFFVLPFSFAMAGSTYVEKYPISEDFSFLLEQINSFSARAFTLQIRDEKISEDFFISPVRNTLITGDGKDPYILPRPQILRAGTTIAVTITDTDPAGASTPVQVALIGYKVRGV